MRTMVKITTIKFLLGFLITCELLVAMKRSPSFVEMGDRSGNSVVRLHGAGNTRDCKVPASSAVVLHIGRRIKTVGTLGLERLAISDVDVKSAKFCAGQCEAFTVQHACHDSMLFSMIEDPSDVINDNPREVQAIVIGLNALYRAIDRAGEFDAEFVTKFVNGGCNEESFRISAVREQLKRSCSPFWYAFLLLAHNHGTEKQQAVRYEMLIVLAGLHATSKQKHKIRLWSENGLYFQSPLHYVTRHFDIPDARKKELIDFLCLNKICDVNFLDSVGRTAIFYARSAEICTLLANYGVAPREFSFVRGVLENGAEKIEKIFDGQVFFVETRDEAGIVKISVQKDCPKRAVASDHAPEPAPAVPVSTPDPAVQSGQDDSCLIC